MSRRIEESGLSCKQLHQSGGEQALGNKWPFMKDTKAARALALEGHARRVHGRVQEEATLPVSDSAARAESHPFESTEGWVRGPGICFTVNLLWDSHISHGWISAAVYTSLTWKLAFEGSFSECLWYFLWVFIVLDAKMAWNWSSGKPCLLVKDTRDVCFIKKWIDRGRPFLLKYSKHPYNHLLPLPCFPSHISSPDPSLPLSCCMYIHVLTWLHMTNTRTVFLLEAEVL